MAYFDCIVGGSGKGNTLVVTCADDLAGATITCTNGTKTYTKTCPSTAPYEVTFYGLVAGTWTVSATVSGDTYTTTVVITDYEAELGGFNWKTWVDLSENYTSSDFTDLDELLDTELAVRELMTIHACVDYLAGIAAESADVETIIGNDLCAKWINLRDYALDTLYANEIIADYMDTADKYFYGEWCLMPQVPTMTSNTAPYGTASSTLARSGYEAYKAFDGNDTTFWATGVTTLPHTIYYEFTESIELSEFSYLAYSYDNAAKDVAIVDANGNELETFTLQNTGDKQFIKLNGTYTGGKFGLKIKTTYNSVGASAKELQFYAWAPKGNVPVMTSNSAPYGEAFASNSVSGYSPYNAFDKSDSSSWCSNTTGENHIGYKFATPVAVTEVSFKVRYDNLEWANANLPRNFSIQGSNTGNSDDWHTVASYSNQPDATAVLEERKYKFSNTTFYLYYRLNGSGNTNLALTELQFYGRELSVSVPAMTGNTTPYGEVIYSSQYGTSPYYSWQAFDQSALSADHAWLSEPGKTVGEYIGYDFKNSIAVKMVVLRSVNNQNYHVVSAQLQGYSNGEWHDIQIINEVSATPAAITVADIINTNGYEKYRLVVLSVNSGGYCGYGAIQFYGVDYSEKEFEEGTTKKWLYDHGVELVDWYVGSVGTKGDSYLKYQKTNSSSTQYSLISTDASLDLTSYTLLRAKEGANGYNADRNAMITLAVEPNKGTWSSTIAYRDNGTSDAPNNMYLDITAINQTAFPSFGWAASYAINYDLTEIWLE